MSDNTSIPSRPATPVAELPNFSHVRPYRFTWDAAARRPGPGSISATTEGRGDYFGDATPYDVYNNASLASLQLGALPSDWSSARHGFHAISTVVNSPHKRSDPPKAHSSLPAVPPAELPRVRRKDFDPYLSAVAPEWERFQKNAEQGREGSAQIPLASLPSSSSEFDSPYTPRLPPSRTIPPLEGVPAVFFEPDFDLGDPRTFNAVTEQVEGDDASSESDPSALSYSLPLLEKLSHHADTIEQHLVREISVRSTSFFAALSNLQDLQTESEQCLDRIAKLRGLLKDVDEKGARRGLEIVRRECRQRNLASVRERVKLVGGVVEMTGVAKGLVAAGQWGEALDVIDELDGLWEAGSSAKPAEGEVQSISAPPILSREGTRTALPPVPESPPESPGLVPADGARKPAISVPLSSLNAFASLPAHLRTLTMEITSSLTSEFVNVLRLDLVERIDADPASVEQGRKDDRDMSLKDRMRPLLQCLARTKGIREATVSWREIVMTEVRTTLRRRIPASDIEDEDAKASGSTLATELRSMAHPAFMDLARIMYSSLLRCIEGLHRQNAVIANVLQAIRSPKAVVDIPLLQEELSGILSSAAELAHTRASKVVALRAEQHAALDLPSFCSLFNESWTFVIESEKICRRMIVGLRGTVISQAKSFLQTFHQAQISHSAKLVEDEQWNAVEVAPSVQRLVDLLVDASISDPPELLLNYASPTSPLLKSPVPTSPALSPNGVPATHRPASPLPSPAFPLQRPQASRQSPRRTTTSPSKHLRIEDRSYFAVSATLEVLVLLVDYLKIVMNLEMLTTETMSRVIELLKSFNSRTCQVVLGAGAMRSAGLKNITARHLALASQSLSIVISLIPYVRETFRRHLSQKQAVMLVEYDKLKRDYQEHQNEIHQKLIAIMGDRLSAHIKSLQDVKWDVPKEGVNDYMEVIVKDTVTLHKVLSRYLSSSVVEYVMTQVFAGINHRLSEEYSKIELPSQDAKERLLADARYLHQKLTGLKNVGAPTAMLEIIVSEKPIARPTPPPAPASAPATQRIKGILSRSDSKRSSLLFSNLEKALPSPTPPPVATATPTPESEQPLPDVPAVDLMADNAPSADPIASVTSPPAEVVNGEVETKDIPAGEPPEIPPKSEGDHPSAEGAKSPSLEPKEAGLQNGDGVNGHAGGVGADSTPLENGT